MCWLCHRLVVAVVLHPSIAHEAVETPVETRVDARAMSPEIIQGSIERRAASRISGDEVGSRV
jgi:hypothetical protein